MDKIKFQKYLKDIEIAPNLDFSGPRLTANFWHYDTAFADLPEEQLLELRNKFMEYKDYFLKGEWDWVVRERKRLKRPRRNFWWYLDEL